MNNSFQSFSGGLHLPANQLISWNDRVARIKLISAEPVHVNGKDWSLTTQDAGSIPTDPLVKEFYSRFR